MSKATVSIKSGMIEDMTAQNRRLLNAAVSAGIAVETVSDAKVHRAVATAHALKVATGLSGNAVAEVIAVAGGASRATTHRFIAVGGALSADVLSEDRIGRDAVMALAGILYTVAGRGRKFGGGTDAIKGWLERVAKTSEHHTPATIVASAEELRSAVMAAESKPTAPARRPVGGTPDVADKGKTGDTDPADGKGTGGSKLERTGDPLAAASVLSLIAELTRRVAARGFTPDAEIVAAFDALASEFDEAVCLQEPVPAE